MSTSSDGSAIRHGRRPIWPWLVAAGLVALAFFLAIAWSAGQVPGQPEATRVAITPFADIPGFAPPTAAP